MEISFGCHTSGFSSRRESKYCGYSKDNCERGGTLFGDAPWVGYIMLVNDRPILGF